MLTLIPKPRFTYTEQYTQDCIAKNLKYVWYFSLFGALLFSFHLAHHFRLGYEVFSTEMLPYTLLYCVAIVYSLFNVMALHKCRAYKRFIESIELLFPFFVAAIAVSLSYFSANDNLGVTPFAIIIMIVCFTVRGHFLLLCTTVAIAFISLSILLIWYSNNLEYSPLVATSFTTSLCCIVVANITERMRIQQFEVITMLNNSNEQLKFLSSQDHLSGLLNRRAIDEILSKEMSRSARFQHPLTILLIDIDNFKQINDNYGHVFGDTAIRNVANNIKTHIRLDDYVGRIGGDEFIVILIESDLDSAIQAANRIRGEVANQKYEHENLRVTVSIGLAVSEGFTAEAFMQKADSALYMAKKQGKNRVSLDVV